MSKKSKTDLLVRQRFQNPLPAPSFPPKLLTIHTDPSRYATYDFLVPLALERTVPMIVDAEGGMPFDPSRVAGYWEDVANQGRSSKTSKMVPDLESSAAASEMDPEDLALLMDPPGGPSAGSGMINHGSSGSNLDAVGNRVASGTSTPLSALDRRKQDVAWLKRSGYAVASDAGSAQRREAQVTQLVAQQAAAQVAELTTEQQIDTINMTFTAIEDAPLSSLKHPTKAHLTAVDSYEILPDDPIWANQYATFKFADNPLEDRKLGSSAEASTSSSANFALFRPLEASNDENRIAYFLPDDEDVAVAYGQKRREGRNVDEVFVDQLQKGLPNDDEEPKETEGEDGESTFGFRFVRDYDAFRREVKSEFIFMLSEGDSTSEGRARGAYYIPLTGHTLLRKRRARRGEVANDYSDIGAEFWGGVLVSVAGKEVLPEDEIEGRRDELAAIVAPLTESSATAVQEPVAA